MAVEIRPRSSWGARYSDGDLTLSGLADEVFAHHTVTTQLSPDASLAAEQAEMRKIEAIGQSRFGTGLSYNVIIFPSGRAHQGASFHRRGTHTGGRNSTARSICFAGNYDTNKPTAAQLATAAAIYHEGKGKWWKSTAPLRGHRDVKGTACPGKYVYAQLPAIRAGKIRTQQEVPDMDATQAKQLSETRALVGQLKELLGEVHSGVNPKIDLTADGSQKVTLRTAIKYLLAARTNAQAISKAVTTAVTKELPNVDPAAITKTVTAAVDKALADIEITLTKES
jgi:hypothetical protein